MKPDNPLSNGLCWTVDIYTPPVGSGRYCASMKDSEKSSRTCYEPYWCQNAYLLGSEQVQLLKRWGGVVLGRPQLEDSNGEKGTFCSENLIRFADSDAA